jgi:hypothetical protein
MVNVVKVTMEKLLADLRESFPEIGELNAPVPDDIGALLAPFKEMVAVKDARVFAVCEVFKTLGLDKVYEFAERKERKNLWRRLTEISKMNVMLNIGGASTIFDRLTQSAMAKHADGNPITQSDLTKEAMESGAVFEYMKHILSSPEKLKETLKGVSYVMGEDLTELIDGQDMEEGLNDLNDPSKMKEVNEHLALLGQSVGSGPEMMTSMRTLIKMTKEEKKKKKERATVVEEDDDEKHADE